MPDNKRVRENTLSENTAAYAGARKRLPLDTILEFSRRVCDYLGRISEPVIEGRRVFILDGTTITLVPTECLKEAYPPATNQRGESVWPVAQFRRQAAALIRVKPRRLSFKGVWTTLKDRLLLQPACSLEEWLLRYSEALYRASERKLPNRKQPRSYPRKAHPRSPKSTKFEKAQRKRKAPDDESSLTVEK